MSQVIRTSQIWLPCDDFALHTRPGAVVWGSEIAVAKGTSRPQLALKKIEPAPFVPAGLVTTGKGDFPMAHTHSHDFDSLATLPTLSAKARARSAILHRLAADLERHDADDADGDARITAVVDVLLNGTDAELAREELDFLLRLDVPRVLVAGDTRER